jgi:ABC-type branched-subunit amino acid transport system substrate-binding protein
MRSTLLSLAVCGALTACGSTALRQGAVGPVGGAAQDGEGLSVVDRGSTGTGGSATGGSSTSGTVGGTPGLGGTGGTSGGSTGGSTGAGGSSATGGTSTAGGASAVTKPIKVGITYPDTTAIATAFGQESHDAAGFITKIIDYINKTGGIGGRKIEPVYHKFGIEEDASAAGQRACTTLTQDKKVDIVFNGGIGGDTLPACLGRAGVSMLDGTGAFDASGEQRIRNRFAPSNMRMDRQALGILNIYAQAGKIKAGDTLGILVEDCDWGNRIFTNVIEPRAKQLGLKAVKGTMRCIQNLVSDLGPLTNDVQRETLRFRTEGVTRVQILSNAEAFILSRFTETASQQSYHPKYFVSSQANPYNNTRSGAIIKIAEDARPNIVGAGTLPLLDVGVDAKPAHAQQLAAQKRCKAADPDEGLTAGEDDPEQKPFNRSVFFGVCDGLYALKALLEANGTRFGLSDVTGGYYSALSGNRTAAANLSSGYFGAGQGRLDGIGALRPFAWDTARKTFKYTGNAITVP